MTGQPTLQRLGKECLGAGRLLVVALPYAWLTVFLLAPLLIVLKISLSEAITAIPPFAPILRPADGFLPDIHITFENFALLAEDPLYGGALWNSIKVAAGATLLCLLLGYPMALAIARARQSIRPFLLMLIIIPFWTSFLIRVYALIGLIRDNGALNSVLMWAGVTDGPVAIMYTPPAVFLGITYSYLPFMILPVYAVLERQDRTLLEAAADLGARPWRIFLSVTLPLSLPGIVAGSMLVFIPAVGEFVIPELLGGPDSLMIGRVLWSDFFANRDWPVAAAVAIALLVLLVVPMLLFQRGARRQFGAAR
jgi:putrescine transport system permease protein